MKIARYLKTLLKDVHFLPNLRKLEILENLKKNHRYQDAKSLVPHGFKIYSQNDEDGIIREIFGRIGTTNKIFLELGIGDGLENNTLALLFEDWKWLWIEGLSRNANRIDYPAASGRGIEDALTCHSALDAESRRERKAKRSTAS